MFKTIPGFSKYEVDEYGNVKNKKGLFLKYKLNKAGYEFYGLTNNEGKHKSAFKHRIVLLAFNYIDNYQEMTVNHIDGNKLNNHVSNLEWCTTKENTHHAIMNNLYKKPRKLVTDETVIKIRTEYIPGPKGNYKELMKKYNIGKSMFFGIVKDQHRTDLPLTKDLNPYFKEKNTRCNCEDNGRAILTKEDVIYIRNLPNVESIKNDLAKKYKVTVCCINNILKRRTWKNV